MYGPIIGGSPGDDSLSDKKAKFTKIIAILYSFLLFLAYFYFLYPGLN